MKINSNFKREKSAFAILRMLRRSDIGRGGLTFYVVKNVNGQWAYQVCDMPKNRSELTFKAGFERDNWFITLFEHEARKLVDFLNSINEAPDTYPFEQCEGMMCDPKIREVALGIIQNQYDGSFDFWCEAEDGKLDVNIFDNRHSDGKIHISILSVARGMANDINLVGSSTLAEDYYERDN